MPESKSGLCMNFSKNYKFFSERFVSKNFKTKKKTNYFFRIGGSGRVKRHKSLFWVRVYLAMCTLQISRQLFFPCQKGLFLPLTLAGLDFTYAVGCSHWRVKLAMFWLFLNFCPLTADWSMPWTPWRLSANVKDKKFLKTHFYLRLFYTRPRQIP